MMLGLPFSKTVGLQRGDGNVQYREYYSPEDGRWRCIIRMQSPNRKVIIPFSRSFYVLPDIARTNTFLFYSSGPRGRSRSKRFHSPLLDGVCLICGEGNPFLFQYDHPFGWQHDKDFRITLCANCHYLKSTSRFWILEQYLEKGCE